MLLLQPWFGKIVDFNFENGNLVQILIIMFYHLTLNFYGKEK